MANYSINDLRRVEAHFRDKSVSAVFVHKDQVDVYLEALVELHHTRRPNPCMKMTQPRLWKVDSCELAPFGVYWYTTPGMKADIHGAAISDFTKRQRIWTHPDLVDQERQDQ